MLISYLASQLSNRHNCGQNFIKRTEMCSVRKKWNLQFAVLRFSKYGFSKAYLKVKMSL